VDRAGRIDRFFLAYLLARVPHLLDKSEAGAIAEAVVDDCAAWESSKTAT
jgi:hypothetical protein